MSSKCFILEKCRLVIEIVAASISLAHTGTIPQRAAANGNTPIPSNKLPNVISGTLGPPLSFDGEDALQRCGGDPQPLGHGDVVFHGLGDGMAAHHQHMGAPQQVAFHVNPTLVLLGNSVVEEQRQIQRGANRRKASLVHRQAVPGRLFRVLVVLAALCGGDIRKGPFHRKPPFPCVQPFPIHGKGGSGGYAPSCLREWHSRGRP